MSHEKKHNEKQRNESQIVKHCNDLINLTQPNMNIAVSSVIRIKILRGIYRPVASENHHHHQRFEDNRKKVMQSPHNIVQEVQCASIGSTFGYYLPDHVISPSIPVTIVQNREGAVEYDIESFQEVEEQRGTEIERITEKELIATQVNEEYLAAHNVAAPYFLAGAQRRISYSILIMLIMIMIMMIGSSTVLLVSYVLDIRS